MIETVIFDIGGTLLDAPDLFSELSVLFPGAHPYDRLRSVLLQECRLIADGQKRFATMKEIISYTLRTVSEELGSADVSARAGEIYYNTFVTQSRLYDDTVETLEFLKEQGITLIVASDGDSELLYDEFKMHGIGGYFKKIFISSEVGAYKPSDVFVNKLRPEIGGSPQNVLFVGDSAVDILAGKKLGVRTALKGGAAPETCPDYRIEKLVEIEKLIASY